MRNKRILVGNPEGKRRLRWEDNIKRRLKQKGYENLD
jgi:hypothetical protein